MTPKEKARQITDKFYKIQITSCKVPDWDISKQQAVFLCDEVTSLYIDNKFDSRYHYYMEVKNQISKL